MKVEEYKHIQESATHQVLY
jgi:dynein heavy chain